MVGFIHKKLSAGFDTSSITLVSLLMFLVDSFSSWSSPWSTLGGKAGLVTLETLDSSGEDEAVLLLKDGLFLPGAGEGDTSRCAGSGPVVRGGRSVMGTTFQT